MSKSIVSLFPFTLAASGVATIRSSLSFAEPNRLRINYLARGEIGFLILPGNRSPRRADRLWQHTCFELFLRTNGDSSYCEFNFSPSGEWAAYEFRDYRDGRPIDDEELSPEIVVRRRSDRIELDAVVRLDRLSVLRPAVSLRIGLSAVIESGDGTLSYWALKHPAPKPDFHHPDSFALELALPSQGA